MRRAGDGASESRLGSGGVEQFDHGVVVILYIFLWHHWSAFCDQRSHGRSLCDRCAVIRLMSPIGFPVFVFDTR